MGLPNFIIFLAVVAAGWLALGKMQSKKKGMSMAEWISAPALARRDKASQEARSKKQG